MLKVPKVKKDVHEPPAAVEKHALGLAKETALRLQKEWMLRKHRSDLVAIVNWLSTTERKRDQASGRLDRLGTWVDLYNEASEATRRIIHLRESWLSSRSSEEKGWDRLSEGVQLSLSLIKTHYGSCARGFEKDSGSFADKRAEILIALSDFKDKIDKIEANLRDLRGCNDLIVRIKASLPALKEAQEDTKLKKALEQIKAEDEKRKNAFKQIQREVENMVNCLIHQLCEPLYSAISKLMDTLDNQVKEL